MSCTYAWLCETVAGTAHEVNEDSEILDHNYAATYAEALTYTRPDDKNHDRIVLVRISDDPMAWAYIKDGRLPTHFSDAWGAPCAKVPQRYHAELHWAKCGGAS